MQSARTNSKMHRICILFRKIQRVRSLIFNNCCNLPSPPYTQLNILPISFNKIYISNLKFNLSIQFLGVLFAYHSPGPGKHTETI